MTKTKAKNLISALIEDNFEPTISVDNNDYTITVVANTPVTTAQIQSVETAMNIVATIKVVKFN